MPKKPDPELPPLGTQENTTVTRTMTGAGFVFTAARADKKDVEQVTLARHGKAEVECRSCTKPMPLPALGMTREELGGLIRLLTKARDEMLPALDKYGVEE